MRYKELYDFTTANDLKIRPLLKRMVLMECGEAALPAGVKQ